MKQEFKRNRNQERRGRERAAFWFKKMNQVMATLANRARQSSLADSNLKTNTPRLNLPDLGSVV